MTVRDQRELETLMRQDVEELTETVRSAPSWSDVREFLSDHKYDPATLLLAFLMESEDCEQLGAFVTRDRRVLRFIRTRVPEDMTGRMRVTDFRDVTDEPARIDEARDEIETAMRMISELPVSGPGESSMPTPDTDGTPGRRFLQYAIERFTRRRRPPADSQDD